MRLLHALLFCITVTGVVAGGWALIAACVAKHPNHPDWAGGLANPVVRAFFLDYFLAVAKWVAPVSLLYGIYRASPAVDEYVRHTLPVPEKPRRGRWVVDLETPLESAVSQLGCLGWVVGLGLMFYGKLEWALGSAVLGFLFFKLRKQINNRYEVDFQRRQLLFCWSVAGLSGERLVARFEQLVGVSSSGQKNSSEESGTWWNYATYVGTDRGRLIRVSDFGDKLACAPERRQPSAPPPGARGPVRPEVAAPQPTLDPWSAPSEPARPAVAASQDGGWTSAPSTPDALHLGPASGFDPLASPAGPASGFDPLSGFSHSGPASALDPYGPAGFAHGGPAPLGQGPASSGHGSDPYGTSGGPGSPTASAPGTPEPEPVSEEPALTLAQELAAQLRIPLFEAKEQRYLAMRRVGRDWVMLGTSAAPSSGLDRVVFLLVVSGLTFLAGWGIMYLQSP